MKHPKTASQRFSKEKFPLAVIPEMNFNTPQKESIKSIEIKHQNPSLPQKMCINHQNTITISDFAPLTGDSSASMRVINYAKIIGLLHILCALY